MEFNDSGLMQFPNDYANSTALSDNLRVTLDANGNLAYAGATQAGLGTLEVSTIATDIGGTVRLWNKQGTRFMIANGAIPANAPVFAAAGGKVSATGAIRIGINVNTAASADGDLIEVLPDTAVGLVEMAAAVVASTAINTTTLETPFDNASYTIPVNGLKVGDVIHVVAQGTNITGNSTDTLTVKLKIGTTVIVTTAAVDVTDAGGDVFYIDAYLVIRTIGANGTFVATGVQGIGVPGTVTAKPFFKASTAIDTTAVQAITATATWSVSNASDNCRLDVFIVEHKPRVAA